MSVIVQKAADLTSCIGKKVQGVSLSAFDMGLHYVPDAVYLIESPWSLKDREGREMDRVLGYKIRTSANIFILVGQLLRKLEASDFFLNLVFDVSLLRITLGSGSDQTVNLGAAGWLAGPQNPQRWDPLALTAPGYLISKKSGKKAPVYKVKGSRKDPEDFLFLQGCLVSRVFWSAEDAGISFQGQQRLVFCNFWVLTDATGRELDRAQPLAERNHSALFRLIGAALLSSDKSAEGTRFCFTQGLVLTARRSLGDV